MDGPHDTSVSGFSFLLMRRFGRAALLLSFAFLIFFAIDSWAGVGGSVSGTVKDSSNAVVPNATVEVTNIDTGIQQRVATNNKGYYSFPQLPVGHYNISIEKIGFKPYQYTGLVIDANGSVVIDAMLEIGGQAQ